MDECEAKLKETETKIEDARSRESRLLDSAGRGAGQNKVALGIAEELGDNSAQHHINLAAVSDDAAIDPNIPRPIQAEKSCILSTTTGLVSDAKAAANGFKEHLAIHKTEMGSLSKQFAAVEQILQQERPARGHNAASNDLISEENAATNTIDGEACSTSATIPTTQLAVIQPAASSSGSSVGTVMVDAEAAKPLASTTSEKTLKIVQLLGTKEQGRRLDILHSCNCNNMQHLQLPIFFGTWLRMMMMLLVGL